MKSLQWLIWGTLFVSSAGFAAKLGKEVGNGGVVIVCREGTSQEKVELLDVNEARRRHINLSLGGPELSVQEKFEIMMKRLKRFDPDRAEVYENEAKIVFSDIAALAEGGPTVLVTFTDDELTPSEDDEHTSVPVGCRIGQMILRKVPSFEEDRVYTVNAPLWNKLDNDNKAAAIAHELFYGDALNQWQTNSVRARYLNSKFFSADSDTFTLRNYADLLRNVNFTSWTYHGVPIQPETVVFDQSSLFKARSRKRDSAFVTYTDPFGNQNENRMFCIAPDSVVAFYPDGKIRSYYECSDDSSWDPTKFIASRFRSVSKDRGGVYVNGKGYGPDPVLGPDFTSPGAQTGDDIWSFAFGLESYRKISEDFRPRGQITVAPDGHVNATATLQFDQENEFVVPRSGSMPTAGSWQNFDANGKPRNFSKFEEIIGNQAGPDVVVFDDPTYQGLHLLSEEINPGFSSLSTAGPRIARARHWCEYIGYEYALEVNTKKFGHGQHETLWDLMATQVQNSPYYQRPRLSKLNCSRPLLPLMPNDRKPSYITRLVCGRNGGPFENEGAK